MRYFPSNGNPAEVENITDLTYDPDTGAVTVTVTVSHFSTRGVVVDETLPEFTVVPVNGSNPVRSRTVTVTGNHDGTVAGIQVTGDVEDAPVAATVAPPPGRPR